MVDCIKQECAQYGRLPGLRASDWQLRDMYINLYRQNPPEHTPETAVRIIACHRLGDVQLADFHRNKLWNTVRHVTTVTVPNVRKRIIGYAISAAVWITSKGTMPPESHVPDDAAIIIGGHLVKLRSPELAPTVDRILLALRGRISPRGINYWAAVEAVRTLKSGGTIDECCEQSILRAFVA